MTGFARGGRRIAVTHVVTGLAMGGAERMLVRVLEGTNRERICPAVVSLGQEDALADDVIALDVPLVRLHMAGGRAPGPGDFLRLVRALRRNAPDVVQGWMYHACIAAVAARPFLPGAPPVVWNVRHSVSSLDQEDAATRRMIRLSVALSRFAKVTIYNAHVTARQHRELGYRGPGLVIPNGFDGARFAPSPEARRAMRQELDLPEAVRVVGQVARFHPMKDHRGFVRAVSQVMRERSDVRVVLAGPGVVAENAQLKNWVEETGMPDRFHLIGLRRDVPRIMAGLDLLVVASAWGEAFPNVVGEGMACGVPAVVTDVGDARELVGETGFVVAPSDPEALAEAIGVALDEPEAVRRQRSEAARRRIVENYSIERIVRRYEGLHLALSREEPWASPPGGGSGALEGQV